VHVHLQEGTAFFPGSSLAGNGLLVSDGPLWRRQRQLANPAFRRRAIESYAQVKATFSLLFMHTQ
jgi:cytochrome P450